MGLEFRTHPLKNIGCATAGLRRLEAPGGSQLEARRRLDGAVEERLQAERRSRGNAYRTGRSDTKGVPFSETAFGVANERWKKVHKEPEDQNDAKAWAAYNQVHKEALKGWNPRFHRCNVSSAPVLVLRDLSTTMRFRRRKVLRRRSISLKQNWTTIGRRPTISRLG